MARILVIEDDPDIVELLRFNLTTVGAHEVESAATGSEGMARLRSRAPDLVILDLMLPGLSGFDICRQMRSDPALSAVPVIMLTARGEEPDVIAGIELGADDYVRKPFSPRELVARVGAVLRRVSRTGPGPDQPTANGVLRVGSLTVDPTSHRVLRDGVELSVTHLEFRLLHHLAAHPNQVFSREQLLDRVWGRDKYVTLRSVDVYVRRLRQKVDVPGTPSLLKTVRGAGYRLEPPR